MTDRRRKRHAMGWILVFLSGCVLAFLFFVLFFRFGLFNGTVLTEAFEESGYYKAEEAAMEALRRVGLEDKWRNTPHQLSGGQQQRVSIARALCARPSIILADEPTGALDSRTSRDVLGLITELNKEGNTIVMITHDPSIAMYSKRVVEIMDGRIIFDGDVNAYADHRKLQNGN